MESIFSKNAAARALTVYDQIGPEIEHLQKGEAVRDAMSGSQAGAWAATIALCLLLGLFFMDPFLYSMHKSDAIRAYLYLHNYDSDNATNGLVSSNMFTKGEIAAMNERRGSFQSYFVSPEDAEHEAAAAVNFMNGLRTLRDGRYTELDPIGKLRYLLFVRIGVDPPEIWGTLNPSVE
jgi:hypothetical protein